MKKLFKGMGAAALSGLFTLLPILLFVYAAGRNLPTAGGTGTPNAGTGHHFCSLALIAGSLAGTALGNRLPKRQRLSEEVAKRGIHGLVLNTCRAFIMNDDEDVYDV